MKIVEPWLVSSTSLVFFGTSRVGLERLGPARNGGELKQSENLWGFVLEPPRSPKDSKGHPFRNAAPKVLTLFLIGPLRSLGDAFGWGVRVSKKIRPIRLDALGDRQKSIWPKLVQGRGAALG